MGGWASFCSTLLSSTISNHPSLTSGQLTLVSMDVVMHANPLRIVAWFTPLFVGGIIIATLGGFVLHVVPGTVFMRVAGVAWVIAPLLFAVMPSGVTYWSFVFPSMIMATIGIDISFNISNIFITTGLTKKQQGLAGAM